MEPPLLSIGLPVYNGENYLREALDSLVGQTFRDLEIVISDNASTDSTGAICQQYMQKDPRIRYYRNETNLGVARNFNRVCDLARGRYFKWASHDDLHAPTFLERCVAVLERDPGVVLCYSRTAIIDQEGRIVRRHDGRLRSDAPEAHVRFHDLLVNYLVFEIFGVMRMEVLRKEVPAYGNFGHSDGVLLARLGLEGRFHEIPEYLSFNREHEEKSAHKYSTYRDYTVWLDPAKAGRILLPRWRMGYEFVGAVHRSSLGFRARALCYAQMGYWVRTFWKSLIANCIVAAGLAMKKLVQAVVGFKRS